MNKMFKPLGLRRNLLSPIFNMYYITGCYVWSKVRGGKGSEGTKGGRK